MIFTRDYYIKRLIGKKDNGLIKIITGLRRSGKSFLLFNLYYDYLIKSGVAADSIITMSFDERRNKEYRNPDLFLEYVYQKIETHKHYYMLLDEIQLLDDFVSVLNELLNKRNIDIYVTGSNAKMLSSDVVTEFRGRGDELRVFPLSFLEFNQLPHENIFVALEEYFIYGGFPQVCFKDTKEEKAEYLNQIFKETYLLDLINRNKIKNKLEFEKIIKMISSNIGSLTNPLKLTNLFKSISKSSISKNTINNYINYIIDAFLIEKSLRYNIKGKKYINSPFKLYFTDMGIRNSIINYSQIEDNHIMENVIYNELLRRDFSVDVGVVPIRIEKDSKESRTQLEIDFVCTKGQKKYYIQSALNMFSDEKRKQEIRPFLKVGDSFKKIVIVKDYISYRLDENGIMTIGIFDFLLKEEALDY
jgi:predicted AAA+ superfamily ATPase